MAGLLAACGGGGTTEGGLKTPQAVAAPVWAVAEEAQTLPSLEGRTVPADLAAQGPAAGQADADTPATAPRATRKPRSVVLPSPSAKEMQSFKRAAAAAGENNGLETGRRQTGIGRRVDATSLVSKMAGLLDWEPLAEGGSVAAVKLSSPGALEIRLGVKVSALPAQAVLRVHGPGGVDNQQVPGRQMLEAIARNRSAGDIGDAGRTYWMPPVAGDEVTLEIELPAGVRADEVELSIPALSHGLVDLSQVKKIQAVGDSQVCNADVSCAGTAYDAESASTVQLRFVEDGAAYNCTGTVMAANEPGFTPYLLTANHCFSNQTVASTLVSTFFLRSTTCNASTSRPTSRLSTGATWLYSSSHTDTTFVKLDGSLPAGARLAGWNTTLQANGGAMLGVHHPASDMQKYATGYVAGYLNCSLADEDGFFSCNPVTQDNSSFYSVDWNTGLTEQGSSGSGVWATINGNRYVVGNLRGGTARCARDAFNGGYQYLGTSIYGRFDIAYNASLKRWLSPAGTTVARTPVYRFYNASAGAHFYTQNEGERDFIIARNPGFQYEGVAFYAYGAPLATGTAPVHRFYSPVTGSHFYTISEAEKNTVLTYPKYTYEGTSWNAQLAAGGTAVPIYRFYNPSRGTHFFTINEQEKDIVRTNPGYVFEGVAYYGWTTP